MDRKFVQYNLMVETIREAEHQEEVTIAYHKGTTNHGGEHEMFQALKWQYFWWGGEKYDQKGDRSMRNLSLNKLQLASAETNVCPT